MPTIFFIFFEQSCNERLCINFVNSFSYKLAASHLDKSITSLVVLEVTLGLPSRSPPIHELNVIGEKLIGRFLPV